MSAPAQISRGSFTILQGGVLVGWIFSWVNPLEELWVLITPGYTWPSSTNPLVTTEFQFISSAPDDRSCAAVLEFLENQTPSAPPIDQLHFQRHKEIVGGLGSCEE